MLTPEVAYAVAYAAHNGQVDGAGRPYIEHINGVLDILRRDGHDDSTTLVVGALHDVVEDTPVTIAQLEEMNASAAALRAIEAITRGENERYFDYIERVSRNRIATIVKLADNEHNYSRLDALPADKAASLAKRYERARRILLLGEQ